MKDIRGLSWIIWFGQTASVEWKYYCILNNSNGVPRQMKANNNNSTMENNIEKCGKL